MSTEGKFNPITQKYIDSQKDIKEIMHPFIDHLGSKHIKHYLEKNVQAGSILRGGVGEFRPTQLTFTGNIPSKPTRVFLEENVQAGSILKGGVGEFRAAQAAASAAVAAARAATRQTKTYLEEQNVQAGSILKGGSGEFRSSHHHPVTKAVTPRSAFLEQN